ncbi:MAG: hypothetical protein HY985_15585 [Magnetospirillum sp.]|nr:hypothetical protein [Magnetospirillum sp.]
MNANSTRALRRHVTILAIVAVAAISLAVARWPKSPTPVTDQSTAPPTQVPASEPASIQSDKPATPRRAERIFDAPAFGRYAVRAVSPFGTSLHLVDVMAGPGGEEGVPGKKDGRIDTFLDPGPHKAVLTLPDKADGPVELKVDAFVERNEPAPALRDFDQLSTELQDLEQRSYWLDVPTRRAVFIEAAGRKLADLRLWKDGTWLVDAEPMVEQVVPRPGRPLQMMRLALELDPGLYRLTAYGGPGVPWTEEGAETPLHLRMGIPTLGEGARRSAVAGPFGLDRWLVHKGATHFRLELPEPGQAAMEVVANFTGTVTAGERVSIDKNSRVPAGDLAATTIAGGTLVSVTRSAGAPYVLQNVNSTRTRYFRGPGWQSIAVTTAGTGDDVDVGALLVESAPWGETVVASSALRLTSETGWMRRFNLLGTVTMFVEIVTPGRYALRTGNVDAEVTIEPFVKGKGYKAPPSKVGGGEWDLDAGFHVITLWPRAEGRGIVTLSINGPKGKIPMEPAPAVAGIDFPKIWLESERSYRLMINQTGTIAGAQVREAMPVELEVGDLPVTLKPEERREAALRVGWPGHLELVAEDGSPLPLSVDGKPAAPNPNVEAGVRTAVLANPGKAPLRAHLRFVPQARLKAAPPPADLSRLPQFPLLKAHAPRFLDLGRQHSATFALKVDKPALYRVESTGLLQTAGNLRTQVRPSLTRATSNGTGRNFLLQQYLRPGLYQLTVSTQNQSAGHLGMVVTASELRTGGTLAAEVPVRASLGAGEGIAYDFTVTEAGSYRFEALTLAGPTELRLEDSDGWPLTNPGPRGTLARELAPGRYRLVVLPQPLPARVVTLAARVAVPVARHGHGPHPLPLGETLSHRWEEPPAGGERTADSWAFTLPADADLRFTLGEGMEGRLERDGAAIAEFNHLHPLARRLEAGAYRLAVRSLQPNNRLDYTITASIRQLVAGTERRISAPATVPVSVGAGGLVDITSFGRDDVRATLRDAHGTVIARADDRANDWNFTIATRLPAGDYRLDLEPVGRVSAETVVRMREQKEVEDPPLASGTERTLADGAMHLMALDMAAADDLVVVAARSEDEAGLALERAGTDGGWTVLGSSTGRAPRLAVARTAAHQDRYRLRAWSLDHTATPLVVTAHRLVPPPASESRLAEGFRLSPLGPLEPSLGAAAVKLNRPGLLQFETAPAGLAWSASPDTRVLAPLDGTVSTSGGRLWLLGEAGATVKARRAVPPAEGVLALTLPEGEEGAVPVDGGRGPQLWLADSRVGQPGIAPAGGAPLASGWGDGQAVAVLTDATAATGAIMRLWRADRPGALPLTLRRISFPSPARTGLKAGLTDGALAAGSALAFALPEGPKQMRLTLPPDTAAVLTEGGRPHATVWAGRAGLTEALENQADGLMLLNAGHEGRFTIDLSPSPPNRIGGLASPGLTSRWLPTGGTVRLDVASSSPVTVQLSGAVEAVRAMLADGRMLTGTRLGIDGPAVIAIRHRAGLVTAWADTEDSAMAWPRTDGGTEAPALPGSVELKPDPWRLNATEPTLLHLATSNPVVVGHRRPGASPDVAPWPAGAAAHLFLPRGLNVVGLRPLHEGPLAGTARLATSPPVAIGEGLGPKVRLAPGDARLFSFALAASGPIGIGVRGGADTARARLMDEAGKVLAEGAVTMTELAAGRYYLQVENRPDAAAVEVQPALVGSTRPDTGPPEDVKRRYWQMVSDEQEVR